VKAEGDKDWMTLHVRLKTDYRIGRMRMLFPSAGGVRSQIRFLNDSVRSGS
jgi:hypothetical protein